MKRWVLIGAIAVAALAACSGGYTPPDLTQAPTGGGQTNTGTIPAKAEKEVEEASTGPSIHCGYERWAPKTGQDATASQVSLTKVKTTTIADMWLLTSPLPKFSGGFPPQKNNRYPSEFQVVTLPATIIAYRVENDSDIHLVISDGQRHTMIAEIPNPGCLTNLQGKAGMGPSPWVSQITAARNLFLAKTGYKPVVWKSSTQGPPFIKANLKATITGVTFFDWPHAQYGAAKTNSVELHPILGITFG